MPGGQVGGDDLQVDAVRGRAGLLLAGLVVGALGGVDDASAGVRRAAEVNRQFEAALARLQLVVGAAWTPELARAFGEEIRAESAAGYSLGAEIARVEETALRWSNNHRRPFVEREGELHGLRIRVTYVEPGQRMMELSAGPVPGRADAGLQLVQVGRESASSRAWHRAARWAENLANEARMVGLPVEAVARAHAEVWASLDLGGVGVVAEDIDDPHSEEGRERARWYAAVYQARLESEVEQLARAMGQHPADLFEAIERLQPPVASTSLRRLEVRDDLVKPDALTPAAKARRDAWYEDVLARKGGMLVRHAPTGQTFVAVDPAAPAAPKGWTRPPGYGEQPPHRRKPPRVRFAATEAQVSGPTSFSGGETLQIRVETEQRTDDRARKHEHQRAKQARRRRRGW